MSNTDNEERQETEPTGRVVYGQAFADFSTVATDDEEEEEEEGDK